MTKRLMLVFFIFFSISVITCEKYIIVFPEIDDTVKIDFITEILPIFDNDCKICHSGGREPNLSAENAYNSIIEGNYVDTLNPESSIIYNILLPSGTHNGRTTTGNIDKILVWISQGASYSVDGDSIPVIVELISFWNQIIPIFENNNCTDCHGTGQTSPDLTSHNAFASLIENNLLDTVTPDNSGLYTVLSSGFHEEKVSGTDRDTILIWISQGAVDDTPPEVVSFSENLQPIFDASCIGCHSSGSFLDLTSGASYNTLISGGYVDTVNPESSILYTNFNVGQTHAGRTSDANLQLFLSWIKAGAADNK